ncbi:MAG TPA: cyclopropane-fatty-acyl-phospholipid synthase family protein [Candidatus Polarisedimenticolaceae bacterium]
MGTTARPFSLSRRMPFRVGAAVEGRLLRAVASRLGPADVRFAVGATAASASRNPPVATVRFRDLRTLLALALDPAGRFGDAYAEGRVEVEGDLVAAIESVYRAMATKGRPSLLRRLGTYVPHTLPRDRRCVHHHYDLGNDFYRLWLDARLLYTCAYFESEAQSLEQAQVAKMEHVCRKLGLRSGETVIEAGCGWGALALHMARHHGVRVRAYNVSSEQIAWARRLADEEGLSGRVEFLHEDYRRIDGRCDVFVSVGMLEHVGLANYRELARVLTRTLDRERGRGLLHFIGRDYPQPLDPWIRRRIFPGAYAPTLDEACRGALVPAGMSVVDVENLRPHYALTLRHWRERYERACSESRVGFDERFRRTWRLYLAGSEAAFRTGSMQLFQVVFAPSGANGAPWTRDALYRSADGLVWNAPTS